MNEYQQLSCYAAGQYDKKNGLKDKLTSWGKKCKARSGPNSKSQKRKRNKKGY